MPTTPPLGAEEQFGGVYITDPDDFNIVATEGDIIQGLDDVGDIEAETFSALTAEQWDRIIPILNEIVLAAEGELNGYAFKQNYRIPLSPLDIFAKNIVVKLAWISLRARRKVIDAEQAERERNQLQNGELRAIGKGDLILSSERNLSAAAGSHVYGVTSSARVMSRETLKGW